VAWNPLDKDVEVFTLRNSYLGSQLNSTQLKFIENGSRMAKGIQYTKTTQMINVNENF